MSKINPVVTAAFGIAHTQKQIGDLENRIIDMIEQVQTLKGEKGDKGDIGERGPAGGPPGPQGPIGPSGGEKGEQGIQGLDGAPGKDGPRGEIGPRGLKGEKGNTGIAGRPGKIGAKGDKGVKGDKGDRGPTGERGEIGPKGERGSRGEKGDVGATGPAGQDGKDAPDYRERFEDALLAQFNTKLTENTSTVNKNVERTLANVQKSLSSLGGGGSYKIVDNADVDKAAITSLVDDAVLIYDPLKKKFVAQSFLSILDRLKADLEVQYDKLVDEDATNSFTYVGEAVPGTSKSDAIWRIKRIKEFVDGDLEIIWAENSAEFDKVWNDRATYEYN